MCPYLDHLMKPLQLPCGIIWISGTSYSVPRWDYGFSYNFTFNIYISSPLQGSRDFKNEETEGLKLVYDEKGVKSRQLASSVCGLSQYVILPSYMDHALLKTVAGWSFSSFILEIFVKSRVICESAHISFGQSTRKHNTAPELWVYTRDICVMVLV